MDTTLNMASGTNLPQFGLGTWQTTSEDEIKRSVENALDAGYRLIDTAQIYGNEHVIGQVLKERFSDGRLKRGDIFITTKVPGSFFESKELTRRCVDLSLKDLQVDYIDMYLIHCPVGLKYKGDNPYSSFDEHGNALLDMNSDITQVWKALEECVDDGRIKAVGVSNFTIAQIKRIQAIAKHPISNCQVELNVYFQQKPLMEFCKENNITVTAYAPLGSPGAEQFKTGKCPSLLKDETLLAMGAKKGKTAAQVAMRFLLQEGIAIIPKSVTPSRIIENSQLFDFTLTGDEMESLRKMDKNLRSFFMPQVLSLDLIDDKPTLVQIMASGPQARFITRRRVISEAI